MIIDIIIIMFILASVFLGYKKGLVKVAIKLLSFFMALLITFILYRPIADIVIKYTNIDESIENIIIEKMDKKNADKGVNDENMLGDNIKDTLLVQTVRPLTYNIIYTGVTIVLFVALNIVLIIVSSLLGVITNLPIIRQFNKTGGILYGIIIGFFIVYVVLLILSLISDVNPNAGIQEMLDNTFFAKVMYENNILKIFLK